VTACVSGPLLGTAAIVWATRDAPPLVNLLLAPAWFLVTVAVAWYSYAWPPLEHRHTSYVLDEDGIEIRSGVVWRAVTNVPRSRVQHIDVSQGPLERAYGLGRLVIYTAGTEHSRVDLPGLNHDVAFELRNHLLPQGHDDAV
jgi:membrane protein YdbS with pleckstrin-like domain